ncbi:MAG: hypothetical protein ACTTIU_05180 [Treponema lecithinolyticum]|uniref:hypothetical protein n=1 Tax=Treponema lecithinolyticum TaxID=53418 RepID=UPI003FA25D55
MVKFVYNSACRWLASKDEAIRTADEVFHALLKYVGKHSVPTLVRDRTFNQSYIAENFSLSDFIDTQQKSDKDFYEVLLGLTDRSKCITQDEYGILYDYSVKIEDNTQFKTNTALKYACYHETAILSISAESFWKKEKLNCSIHNGTFIKKELYNLYSKNISYLPFEEPPFSLSDETRFIKTGRHYQNMPIYKEIKTGYYWYNDYFHRTNKAHFEVFDAQGNHIGEASMQGILNRQKFDKTKTIKHLIN